MINLAYQSEGEYNNNKIAIFKATFSKNYGVNGVGDLLNFEPSQNNGVDGGVTDPSQAYFHILTQPTANIFVSDNLGGSYTQVKPNAVPTLNNCGLQMFEPGGAEKATNAAYTATELAGYTLLMVLIPALQ
jgi:hypothetical protein